MQTLLFSLELRILLLCGSDLLESFCIPGLWNEADVSSLLREREDGRGERHPCLELRSFPPPLHRLESLASPKFPRGQFIPMTMEEKSHLPQALSPTVCLLVYSYLLLLLTPGKPWEKSTLSYRMSCSRRCLGCACWGCGDLQRGEKPLPFGNYRRDLLSFEVFVEVVKPLP